MTSFNFSESVVLAEIYAQAMEENGYPVDRNLNLGSRELIFPEIESGTVDFIPEYLGSSLQVGFGEDAPTTTADGLTALSAAFEAYDMDVLDAAPGQDKNVFVVTEEFAEREQARDGCRSRRSGRRDMEARRSVRFGRPVTRAGATYGLEYLALE